MLKPFLANHNGNSLTRSRYTISFTGSQRVTTFIVSYFLSIPLNLSQRDRSRSVKNTANKVYFFIGLLTNQKDNLFSLGFFVWQLW